MPGELGAGGSARSITVLWVLVLCAVAALWLGGDIQPNLANDSYQYLSVAENAQHGRLAHTSIVYFDAERSAGVLPAPLVTFPPGYAWASAVLGLSGVSLPAAALMVNILAAIGVLLTMSYAASIWGLGQWSRHAILAAYAVNATVAVAVTRVQTETLFTLFAVLGVVLIALPAPRIRGQELRSRLQRAGLGGVCFGLAYGVRYAGLFLCLGLVVTAAWHLVRRDRDGWMRYVVAGAAAAPFVAAGMLRNILLVSNWRGGNEKVVFNAPIGVAIETVRAVDTMLLGQRDTLTATVLHLLFVGVAALALAICLWPVRNRLVAALRGPWLDRTTIPSVEITLIAAVYSATMFYAGITTVISYEGRMFLPVLPLVFLLVARQFETLASWSPSDAAHRSRFAVALVAMMVAYGGANLATAADADIGNRHERLRAATEALRERAPDAAPSVEEIVRALPPGTPVVANDGQLAGYLLDVPTVALVSPEYGSVTWDAEQLTNVMQQYGARIVVLSRRPFKRTVAVDLEPSPFITRLINLDYPSAWLTPVHVSPQYVVYRFTPPARIS